MTEPTRLFRKLRKWWLCRKYGVCPIHLTLMRPGGGYEPKWTCYTCVAENETKNEFRSQYNAEQRIVMCEMLRKLETRSDY